MEEYEIGSEELLCFGDSKEDMDAAMALGAPFVPINYFDGRTGYRNFSEFMRAWGI